MKVFFASFATPLLAACMLLCGCGKHQKSAKTGISYNDKSTGGYERFKQTHPVPGPGLVVIEGGSFTMGHIADPDVKFDFSRRVTVASFYMDETEVANQDWLDYLHWIVITYPKDHQAYYNALPDTLVWRSPLSYNEPYVENYLRHPAFQDYPVVGVSWDQAQAYCQWRTDIVNENILRETGRMVSWKDKNGGQAKAGDAPANQQAFNTDMYLNGQLKGPGIDGKKMMPDLNPNAKPTNGKAVRPVRQQDGILKPPYRLPTEVEWEYAALALIGNTEKENINFGKIYPWNGLGVRSSKKATQGLLLANFKRALGDNAGVGGRLNDKGFITAPVRSYQPNDFGLYNMAGNVNEWVEDTYRQLSFDDMDTFNPFRGNSFTNKRVADAAKGLYAKDKYGRPIRDPSVSSKKLKYEETLTLQHGDKNDTISLINKYLFKGDKTDYDDPVNPELYGKTTLVNDSSKVYKGGSWNDMAFWLNPAARRFKNEASASADVGFRCAMTLVGPPEIHPGGKPAFKQ